MKSLKDIIYKVSILETSGEMNLDINGIKFDSRAIKKGNLFIAIKGVQSDGHQYIAGTIEAGATAVVCEDLPENLVDGVTYIRVENSGEALGIIASNFYDNPSKKLNLIGITGTNGKTTTVTLLFNLFKELGYNVGLLSTVRNMVGDEEIKSTHTTPDAIQLNALLARMLKAGITHCFMEVSSHAIVQGRISGLTFTGGVFSNISHDHLDYHKTFDEYIKAKKLFFDHLPKSAFALSNADDKRATVMMQNTKASISYFGYKSLSDFKGRLISNTLQGLELNIDGIDAWFRLTGAFNASNLLAVYSIAMLLEEDVQEVLTAMSMLESTEGRFEQIIDTENNLTGIVDYAHTPDALENVLKTINDLKEGDVQVITVVGCGGDRDTSKRPIMAEIAARFSDKVIFTADNPRNEDPSVIIEEMKTGVKITQQKKVLSILDRREAIRTACMLANSGDVILIAGKGHEDYQEIKGERFPFSDKVELKNIFNIPNN